MNDKELMSAIQRAEDQAYGAVSGQLNTERADAIDRYLGRRYGDEKEGRSGVVTSDIRDAVEWIMPQLLRIFMGGDEVIKFDPKGPEDEEAAKQETDYINHVVLEKNPGFLIFNTWFRDCLLQKNGYCRANWVSKSDVRIEKYQGKTDDEIALLMQDPEVEIVAHTGYPDPLAPMPMPDETGQPGIQPMLHDVTVRRKFAKEFVEIANIPPDEMLVSKDATGVSLAECSFVQHRTDVTISDLRQMGYEVEDTIGMSGDADNTTESNARDRFDEDEKNDGGTGANRKVTYCESYIRVDFDGDGITELRKVCHVNRDILANEEAEYIPFAAITPIVFPHRHHGTSLYDLLKEIARIKTIVLRGYLDNLYLSNNVEKVINIDAANLDDFLVSRPGGVKRVRGPVGDAYMPIVPPQVGGAALQGIQYLDSWGEKASGVTAYNQGLDSESLNKTAHGISQIMTAAQGRIEGIARTIAETGVKDLFRIVHAMTLQHGTKADKVKLRNQWVAVNPREWANRTDLTISIGLGSGTKEMQAQQLMMMLQLMKEAIQIGATDPSRIYNALVRYSQAIGFKNPDEFWVDPGKQPPQQKQDPLVAIKGMELQAQGQQAQLKAQVEVSEGDKDRQSEAALEMQRQEFEKQKLAYESQLRLKEKEMEIAGQQHTKLLELAAGVLTAQSMPAAPQNLDDGTKLDTAGQSQNMTLEALSGVMQSIHGLAQLIAAPKQVVRGADGKVSGVQTVL